MSLSQSPFVERLRQFEVPLRWQRPLRLAGYPAFALLVALSTLLLTLPRDRLKDTLETQLSADWSPTYPLGLGMDVTLGDVEITLFSGAGVTAHDWTLRTRPLRSTDKPVRYFIDDATVHIGLFGLLFNRPSYTFKGQAYSGTVRGELSYGPDESRLEVELSGIVLTGVQGASALVGGLPVNGTVSSKLSVVMPKALLNNAGGLLDFEVNGLVIGDGKAKLVVPSDPFLSQGLAFPKLRLGRIAARVMIDKGRGRFEGLVIHSPDGDATLDGYVDLRDPFSSSQLHAYVKFKPSEALLKREPTLEVMSNMLAATAKRPDGYLGIQLTGPLSSLYVLPSKSPPMGISVRSGEPSSSGATAVHLSPPVPARPLSPSLLPGPTPSPSISRNEDSPPEVPNTFVPPPSSAMPNTPPIVRPPPVSHPSIVHPPAVEEPAPPPPPPPPDKDEPAVKEADDRPAPNEVP